MPFSRPAPVAAGVPMPRPGFAALLLVLPLLPAPPVASEQVPCGDPQGCPDLITHPRTLLAQHIEERTFSATSCSVQEGHVTEGTHKLLRFTFTSPNLGPGDLVIGRPGDHPEWFEWAPCHRHYHFKEYADYRLWNP